MHRHVKKTGFTQFIITCLHFPVSVDNNFDFDFMDDDFKFMIDNSFLHCCIIFRFNRTTMFYHSCIQIIIVQSFRSTLVNDSEQ